MPASVTQVLASAGASRVAFRASSIASAFAGARFGLGARAAAGLAALLAELGREERGEAFGSTREAGCCVESGGSMPSFLSLIGLPTPAYLPWTEGAR